MIPAAFDYSRPHTTDEAVALLQQHGSDARVLAGGQSLIPAMRFRLARPVGARRHQRHPRSRATSGIDDGVLSMGALARDVAVERAPWIGEQRWSLLHDVSRVVADPVVRQMATVVGSLCHNDPAGDWTTAALAARAEVARARQGRHAHRSRSTRSSWTASRPPSAKAEMAIGVRFPKPDDRSAGLVPEGRAQGRRLRDRCGSGAGHARRRRHDSRPRASRCRRLVRARCAWTRPRGCSPGSSRQPMLIRAAADAASTKSAPQADLRGSVEYKKHLAGVLVARGLRQALSRLGVQA